MQGRCSYAIQKANCSVREMGKDFILELLNMVHIEYQIRVLTIKLIFVIEWFIVNLAWLGWP